MVVNRYYLPSVEFRRFHQRATVAAFSCRYWKTNGAYSARGFGFLSDKFCHSRVGEVPISWFD